MDLEEIGNKLSNLTFYDIKSFYTQAKNYALNISEIEAKVREATNDDPWGASSTLMQEIAQAHDFNEIMPTIFRRFMEKEARDWRQIYKSLQLLEYIVKHGSERVVDEARAHLATIKILRNFHYIDEKGKDQGINVRNRAKELAALLSDVEMIRAERRKARANRAKYQGTGSNDFVPGSGGGRYGGFSSDAYYAGAAGASHMGSSTYGTAAEPEYDEYDAGDDERTTRSSTRTAATSSAPAAKTQPVVADLFSFDSEEETPAPAPAAAPAASKPAAAAVFDEFDDFQSAPTTTPATAPKPAPGAPAPTQQSKGNLFDFLDDAPPAQSANATTVAPAPVGAAAMPKPSAATASKSSTVVATPTTKPSAASTFDDLWATSRGKPVQSDDKGKKSMAQLAKDQTTSSVWGTKPANTTGGSKDLFDLL
ncbi:Epsin-3, clathrin recruitment and traffic between the Golgi and endosome [Malassezia brasiliensis]|uniref:Epsin-3, clathrin recruitment and traffic between the Golgi and endosome n=1 Tax=Malassezia brasiliensis TaxID=1821822 RepID=A0AAF0IMK9_9BASI|nr:Epsin-3, clathrin recruitment and traffic between the Golgi and endosome [Malassezia brasiliensis]